MAADDTWLLIQRHVRMEYPDLRLAAGTAPLPVRARRLPLQLHSAILFLGVGAMWTAERKHCLGLASSPACLHCRASVQTPLHLDLYKCPEFVTGRMELVAALGVRAPAPAAVACGQREGCETGSWRH